MVAKVCIEDGKGKGFLATITSRGELAVGDLDYSQSYNVIADVINTAYNIVEPMTSMQFVITTIALYADKDVGVNDATVTIYESDSPTSLTSTKDILVSEIAQKTYRDLVGIRLIVTEGKWVNVTTDDDDIYVTILGYYVRSEI